MTIKSFPSSNVFVFINLFAFAGLVSSPSTSLLPFTSAGFVSSLSASFLILVEQDMTKFFYIGKLITGIDNKTALIYTKETL